MTNEELRRVYNEAKDRKVHVFGWLEQGWFYVSGRGGREKISIEMYLSEAMAIVMKKLF